MIREATPEDLDQIFELWCDLMDLHQHHHPVFSYNPDAADALKTELGKRLQDSTTRCVVAEEDDQVVGFLIASFRIVPCSHTYHRKGYIGETTVRENYRDKGIGHLLFDAAKAWLTGLGADHVELQVSPQNKDAIRFWEQKGFTQSTQHMVLTL